MKNAMVEYFEALERLKSNTPRLAGRGTKITNDAVALEAGRGKGSIKKSRPIFADLIVAIDQAAEVQSLALQTEKIRLEKFKKDAHDYRQYWEDAIGREISLLLELYELKQQLRKLTGANVVPLRSP